MCFLKLFFNNIYIYMWRAPGTSLCSHTIRPTKVDSKFLVNAPCNCGPTSKLSLFIICKNSGKMRENLGQKGKFELKSRGQHTPLHTIRNLTFLRELRAQNNMKIVVFQWVECCIFPSCVIMNNEKYPRQNLKNGWETINLIGWRKPGA